jgi:hypothetical protein
MRLGCIVLLATLAAATPASAATVGIEQQGTQCGTAGCAEVRQVVVVSDTGAEPNRLTVEATPVGVIVRDSFAALVAFAPCTQDADHVLCPGETADVRVEAGDGNDTVRVVGTVGADVSGGAGDDDLSGTPALDVLRGGPGRDGIDGGGGDDYLLDEDGSNPVADGFTGGAGRDRVLYTGRDTGVRVDLHRGEAPDGDRLAAIEDVEGGTGDDVLVGDGRENFLFGGPGRDRLVGNAGDDELSGGMGVDSLSGGAGDDRIGSFDERSETVSCGSGADRVAEYQSDQIGENVFEFVLGPDAGDRLVNCERAQIDETPRTVRVRPLRWRGDVATFENPCRGDCVRGVLTIRAGGRTLARVSFRREPRLTVPVRVRRRQIVELRWTLSEPERHESAFRTRLR